MAKDKIDGLKSQKQEISEAHSNKMAELKERVKKSSAMQNQHLLSMSNVYRNSFLQDEKKLNKVLSNLDQRISQAIFEREDENYKM